MMQLASLCLLFLVARDSAPTAASPQPTVVVRTTGFDAAALSAAVDAASRLPRLRSLLVLRDGETMAAHVFHGGPPLDQPVNIKSASKSVMSALIGIAIERGVLTGVDQTVLPLLRSDAPRDPDPRLARVTVGDLLSMQAGLERTSGENYGR